MTTISGDTKLFKPMRIGRHTVSSRIVMAPLTRFRVDNKHVPLPFVKEYYVQRAATPGTLQITEGTIPSARTGGWANGPGIWSEEQIAGWKRVVDGVHAVGGVIFMQLAGLGRVAQPDVLERAGFKVKGPSPIPADSESVIPEELTDEEIWEYVDDFRQAAVNAIDGAGFDGVEVHAANGYLLDQFTQDRSNQRTDAWGGSIEKRARFAIEVTKAVVDAVGSHKTGFRVSPWSEFQGMKMDDAIPQFSYLIAELKKLKLAYLHLVESRVSGSADGPGTESVHPFTEIWANTSPILIAGGFKPDSAAELVDKEYPDQDVAVVLGRYFVSTPDLVYRIQHSLPLTQYDRSRFYLAMQKEGYVDYPYSEEYLAEYPARQAWIEAR